MARNWVRLGHQVTMLAEFPNHPIGVIPPEYRGKLWERSRLEEIDVIRVWVLASPTKNFLNRMLFYISFMFSAFFAGMFLARGQYDLIYASSPPLFVGGAALGLSLFRHIPLVFEVRDLWPESAVALGELTNKQAIDMATKLEEACYRRARLVVGVTQSIFDRLRERGLPGEKLILVTNGANTDMFRFLRDQRAKIRKDLQLEGKFIAIYAGIHGIAQGLETVVEAANLVRERPEIQFLFVGDGPKKQEIEELARNYQLTNITFLGQQPRENMPGLLSASDVALIPLKKLSIFSGALPSKIFDAWACERPILLCVDGEARHVLENCGGGRFIPPEDPQALVQELLSLKDDPQTAQSMGLAGRNFTIANFSRQALAEYLIQILTELSGPDKLTQ